MLGAAILWIGLGSVGTGEFLRPFGAKVFDQATLDAEGFGDKKALARDADGLRVTLAPGQPEAGWKTPPTLRIGGDCTISATLVVRKLPKPGQEDGAAIGLAVATQNLDQPEATLLREIEPDGKDVYRSVDKAAGGNQQQQMMMRRGRVVMFNPFGGGAPAKPAKPIRHTFPAKGQSIRLEIVRKGATLHYQVFDEVASLPREVGQMTIGPGDLMGVKVFTSNRNGTEPVEIVLNDLTIHADRISGLGTAVRTIFGTLVHGDPNGIETTNLIVGGPPPKPPAPKPGVAPAPGAAPANPAAPATAPTPASAPAPAAAPAVAVAVAPAAVIAPAAPAVALVVAAPAVAQPPGSDPDEPDDDDVPQVSQPGAPGQPAQPGKPVGPKPRVPIPLDEVESIVFERSSSLSARFIGQVNIDTTGPVGTPSKDAKDPKNPKDAKETKDAQEPKEVKKPAEVDDFESPPPGTAATPKPPPKVEPTPNGIRDLHFTLSSLAPAAIQQVMIQCQTDKGPASWRLDTTGSQDWPLTVSRAGVESWADLFFEPPVGDAFEKDFTITVTFANGQNANAQAKATAHTDPKLAFDPESPAPALDARVYLAGDEQLYGKLEAISEEALTLTTPWGDKVDLPMTRILGVYLGMSDHKESAESFAKRLKARGDKDLLLARSKDGEVVVIGGIVEAARANKLTFVYQEKTRTIPLKMVEGFVLATRPALKPPTEVRPRFTLGGGIAISGRWDAIESGFWKVETPWGQMLKIPSGEVRNVRFQGGQMTYLSDLEPSEVEETPYFGRKVSYRKDKSLTGEPLKLDGQVIEKGLAVHSRSALTYDIDRRYAKFEALVGFDESGNKKGRVDCRVFADGKEIYANPDLRADAAPVRLSLPVEGAEQLKLVIDFGPDEDTGDRVIWANARLYRKPPAPTTTTTTPPASSPK
jgi:hypothetical protein